MPGCCGLNIVQLNTGGAPFTFSVTGGNSPYNGGLGVITGPLVVNSGDIVTLYAQHAAGALVTTFVNFAFEASSLFQLKKIG